MSKGIQLHASPTQPNPHSGLIGVPVSAEDKSSSGAGRRKSRHYPLVPKRFRALLMACCGLLVLGWGIWLPGCSSGSDASAAEVESIGRAVMVRGGVSALQVEADWDDAEAAVSAALGKSELVKVRLERPDPSRLVYMLRSSRDEPAELTVTRIDDAGVPDPIRMLLTCSIGRFGDPRREREFLAMVATRLVQLRGVEVAPLE